jgi:ribonuclease HI
MMNTLALEDLSRRAVAGISRRRSLVALGGAALGAALTRPGAGEAKKKGNKCKDKEKKRCSNDVASCKAAIQALQCPKVDASLCAALQACCDSCSANGFLVCLLPLQS